MMTKSIINLLTFLSVGTFFISSVSAEDLSMLGEPWSDEITTTASSKDSSILGTLKAGTTSYSYGDPSVSEQVHLEEINRARMDPTSEAASFSIDLNEGLASGTISSDPVQPIVMNKWLSLAAGNHSQDMLDNNYFSHYSENGDTPFERMNAAGFYYWSAGENIAWRGSTGSLNEVSTVIQMHEDLFVDDNYSGRGHRINMLSSSHKEVGLGMRGGPYTYGGTTYTSSFMLTCDFGRSSDYSESFILGVVYEDTDGDSTYDAYEGLSGLEIQILQDGVLVEETSTATAGGYGIPIADGTYTVRVLETETIYAEKTVTVAGLNEKIDFLKSDFTEQVSDPPEPEDVNSLQPVFMLLLD